MKRISVVVTTLMVSAAATAMLLTACSRKNRHQIQAPESWQAHLRAVELPKGFVPAVEETVYVPVYSQIYYEDTRDATLLTGTVSIRNTDLIESIILQSINYYDGAGKIVQEILKQPMELGPLATAEIVVPRQHNEGGSGANFVVRWIGAKPVAEPLVETVMISGGSAHEVSFVSRGVVTFRHQHPSEKIRTATGATANPKK